MKAQQQKNQLGFADIYKFLKAAQAVIKALEQTFASKTEEPTQPWTRSLTADHLCYFCANLEEFMQLKLWFEQMGVDIFFHTDRDLLLEKLQPFTVVKLKEPIHSDLIGNVHFIKLCFDEDTKLGFSQLVFTTPGAPMSEYIHNMGYDGVEFKEIEWVNRVNRVYEHKIENGLRLLVVPNLIFHAILDLLTPSKP